MKDKRTCRDCPLKENCAEYKENKSQSEDYELYNEVLTNEEYIRTCSTGDLAALIYQDRWTQSDGWYEQTGHTVEDVKKWLKEIRK